MEMRQGSVLGFSETCREVRGVGVRQGMVEKGSVS
jgi:hypothetical protein